MIVEEIGLGSANVNANFLATLLGPSSAGTAVGRAKAIKAPPN